MFRLKVQQRLDILNVICLGAGLFFISNYNLSVLKGVVIAGILAAIFLIDFENKFFKYIKNIIIFTIIMAMISSYYIFFFDKKQLVTILVTFNFIGVILRFYEEQINFSDTFKIKLLTSEVRKKYLLVLNSILITTMVVIEEVTTLRGNNNLDIEKIINLIAILVLSILGFFFIEQILFLLCLVFLT